MDRREARRTRMSSEENKRNVMRWREEIWNKRNLDVIDELAAPDYVGHMAGIPGPVRGPEALKHLFSAYLAALDTHVTPEILIAEGDMVVVRDTNWVKSTGAFQGMPPTGKEATVTSTDIYRIVDGRIVEQWFEADLTGMMHQLGLLSTPEHAGS
jgi:predicted SnoaL-like aldol condensation-catalyzing enzyme